MINLAVLPIVIPLLAGIIVAFFSKRIPLARGFTQIVTLLNTLLVMYIGWQVYTNGTIVLETGGWKAPYGIILVADPLAISLIITTNLIALALAFYAPQVLSKEQEEFYFYFFFFLLITGVSGAFLTGDLFNLFVFFEVLLMASYGLIVLGNGKAQLRESLKYVLLNLFSSILFVTAVAFLYSILGTVNMAQMAQRVAEVEQQGILTGAAILLFFVFATKAALFPLYYWLPRSYSVPNSVVSAMFGALLTKVGVYSILRVFTLIFNHKLEITHELFIWLAAFTMIFGAIGAISTSNIKLILAYNIIPAVGYMMMGIGLFTTVSLAGTIYYLIHDMIIKAALFLLVGAIAVLAGTSDLRKIKGMIHHYPWLGWLFFLGTIVLAGIPPFSGFIGKLLLIQGAVEKEEFGLVIISLLTSLLILYSMIRIFIQGFWGEKNENITPQPKVANKLIIPAAFLLMFSILLGVGAEWFYPTVEDISKYLLDPNQYINTVLKE